MSQKEIDYAGYLQLGDGTRTDGQGLLGCVLRASTEHEEHLFITVHHGFEVWFKQIIFDFKEIQKLLTEHNESTDKDQSLLGQIVKLLMRCRDIFRMLVKNFDIIETMGQLAFINFRDKLMGGSGFQSLQFRLIENIFGLPEKNRKRQDEKAYNYKCHFKDPEQMKKVIDSTEDTLYHLIQEFLKNVLNKYGKQRFLKIYKDGLSSEDKELEHIKRVFDEDTYAEYFKEATTHQKTCFTYDAFLGALLIHQLQEKAEYVIPYQIITLVLDMDQAIMGWRARHVSMVHRMIGCKTGTGNTDGVAYLASTIDDRYKVFLDFYNMATFVIPSKKFNP